MRRTLPFYRANLKTDATGPLLSFISDDFAAGQLHQTSHSCIAQHFRRVKVCYADGADLQYPK